MGKLRQYLPPTARAVDNTFQEIKALQAELQEQNELLRKQADEPALEAAAAKKAAAEKAAAEKA